MGAIFDVTARARAEEALRESEERFRAVVDSANEGMLVYDRSLNIIAGNRAAERILGLPLGAADRQARLHLAAALHPRGRHAARPRRTGRRASRCAPASRRPAAHRHPAPDGSVTWLSVNTAFLRRDDETDALRPGLDRHRRHRAARRRGAAARERGALPAHLRAGRLGHRAHRPRPALHPRQPAPVRDPRLSARRSCCGLTGRQISHPDDLDVINEQRPALYSGEIDAVRLEKRYVRKDGSIVWVKFTMTVERDVDGQRRSTRSRSTTTSPRSATPRSACARARRASARPSSSPPRASATSRTGASSASTAACARSSATPRRSCSARR